MLWNPLSGELEDAMALHQVLKESGEIAVRNISLTPTEIFWWTLGTSDADYCR